MTKYITGGPPRFLHQKRGLRKLIQDKGTTALLFDPGTGKTATMIDFLGLLALKSPRREARVLVICPLVAVDTWVDQCATFMSPQVNYYAEAIGGSVLQRCEALAARGGDPFPKPLGLVTPPRPDDGATEAEWSEYHDAVSRNTRAVSLYRRKASREQGMLHAGRAVAQGARRDGEPFTPAVGPQEAIGERPSVTMAVLNLDTFAQRRMIGSKTTADIVLEAVRRFGPDQVVVDESHKIKGQSGNASKLIARIGKEVSRRTILTGTVMPHSPLDVYAQWRFLDPYAFGRHENGAAKRPATFGAFADRYAVHGGWMGKQVVGFQNLDHMEQIMSQRAIVARKSDALDLPPTTDVVVPVHLSDRETKAYDDLRDQLVHQLNDDETTTVGNRLTQMMRLRQITSGHLPSDDGTPHVIGTSKAKVIKSLVHDTLAGERRIVVFALFTAEIDVLADMLAVDGTEVQVIRGGTPQEDRVAMRKRFGSDDPQRIVMVAQVKTMSLAVNELVTASHAIFASLSQQRDDLVQARDRLNRLGQKAQNVTFWYAIARGTVDQVILDSHEQRTNLEAAVLAHVKGEDHTQQEEQQS